MFRTALLFLFAIGLWAGSLSLVSGQDVGLGPGFSPDQHRFFESKIRPLLAAKCFQCHGSRRQEQGLRLDSLDAMLRGGEMGPAVVPGDPRSSLLVQAIRRESLEMPPDDPLPAGDVELLVRWIAEGAYWPAGDRARPALETSAITEEDRSFWSFQPVRDPAIPRVRETDSLRNGIDRFIVHKLQAEGLTPAGEAHRRSLIRRLYADLLGLPPAPPEIDAFVADDSPMAYELLVDRLLASPHYGERWGRRWLDLVRYAESNGHGSDQYRPTAWRYRDYVIRALNEDKPYDRFVREQLAGDEIDPENPDALIATGFLRHWVYESNQRKTQQVREVMLNDVTDVTGDVFLAMGLGCARCHDHKFDPILQEDYYRIQSFFAALLPRDDIPAVWPDQLTDFRMRQHAWEQLTVEVRHKITEIEQPWRDAAVTRAFKMYPQGIKDMYRKLPARRTPLEQVLVALVQRQLDEASNGATKKLEGDAKAAWETLRQQLAAFRDLEPEPLPLAMVVSDIGQDAPPMMVPGQATPVKPGFLSILDPAPAEIPPAPNAPNSTGRRAALAAWLTSDQNPLTARVIVNRVWQYHFGRGLVGTASDFGRLGDRPSHPELLDWLTSRFLESGWRLKPLHRLILTSATYRQSALRPAPEVAVVKDPANRWLWRMNIRRLEAEPIRDAMLAVSGELDLSLGGPSVEASAPRRTVYTKVIRNTPDPLMRAFDAPDGFISTAQRDESTTPTQALMLINGDWSLDRARALAARIVRESTSNWDPQDLTERVYRVCFGRRPEPDERERAESFLRGPWSSPEEAGSRRSIAQGPPWHALVALCHVLLNANEFIYVD